MFFLLYLKQNYTKFGLSKKGLDGVAEILKESITEKTKILETVKSIEHLQEIFQSEIDKERSLKSILQNELIFKSKKDKKQNKYSTSKGKIYKF